MRKKSIQDLVSGASCIDDYDPNSMAVSAAKKYIQDYLTPVITQARVTLRASLGRIVSEAIVSPCNVPNHDNSAMDGYAFNANDIHAEGTTALEMIGTAFAGKPFTAPIGKGQCVRIMTGAVIPTGADTVVMQERVQVTGHSVVLTDAAKRGMNVRYAGEDLKQGQTVLPVGHCIKPADVGLLASLGIPEISVFRRLRVAFFSTGDELTSIGQALATGQIYDSNRYTLHSMLSRLGVDIIDMGVVRDDPALLENALLEAAKAADVIITSGGVSVGEADYMKQLLQKHGQVVFWKIAMKPGRPLAYGKIQQAHYFGLPGNPVATMVTFYQFVRDALLVMMGQPNPPAQPLFNVECTADIKKMKGRTEFQRGQLFLDPEQQTWKVKPIGNQSSGVLRSMSEANCFIVLAEDVGNLPAGTLVQVQLLEGII